jgi:putative protease
MGVVFDGGRPEDKHEPGGPIFRVEVANDGWKLGFGEPGPDLARVRVGDRVWVTSDPQLAREVEQTLAAGEPSGRVAIDLAVTGRAGEPLCVAARAGVATADIASTSSLTPASGRGIDDALLREKLAAFGGTPFKLRELDLSALAPRLHLPVSELKALRRALVDALVPRIEHGPPREVHREPRSPRLRAGARALPPPRCAIPGQPLLLPLCRSDAQLEAVIAAGLREVELDWMEMVGLGRAVARARGAGLRVTLATVRVQKPGEETYDKRLAALEPDAVLVRHWGALVHFQGEHGSSARPILHGDFSLNVTNSITAAELFERGLDTLTAAHDLDATQLFALLDAAPPERFTVVLHGSLATFHTEHCVYSHLLSEGRDFRTCGRPCEHRQLALRDHTGRTHPVIVDVACRNTVFNSQAQSCAELVPLLSQRGVRRFRVEFVRETREEAAAILAAYGDLLGARISPREATERAGALDQFGVSRSAMTVMA